MRQGHRCYYFSKNPATWNEAMFKCRDLRSHLAIIKTAYQDKLIRNVLNRKPVEPLERWLGGVYDWKAMRWTWGENGKHLSYSGFQMNGQEDKDKLRWHCIIMDPAIGYRWNSRTCTEQKHFICHTKMRTVSNKEKKRLQRQYKADKYNKLNEIPVPEIPEYGNGTQTSTIETLKSNVPITYKFEINQHLNDQALIGFAPAEQKRKPRKNMKKQKRMNLAQYRNGTAAEASKKKKKKNRRKKYRPNEEDAAGVPTSINGIQWRTFKKKGQLVNPFYPRPIVEEYTNVKEP
nr:unnamed protein product [Callosobruchus analis]